MAGPVMNLEELPEPGLDGTYRDSCVACLRGTDTAVAFEGEAEWAAVGISRLGLTLDEAALVISQATGCDEGMCPPGQFQIVVRVCRSCAEGKLEIGRFPGAVPCYRQGFVAGEGQHR
jgi:hypothetical protein